MSKNDAMAAERTVATLAARLESDPHLAAEMQRARRQFFQGATGQVTTLPGAADSAAQRFREWLLLERESEVLGAVPIEVPSYAAAAVDLPESLPGVFLVLGSTAKSVEARDQQDGTILDLLVPADSLLAGDLLVGRLFSEGSGRWTPSRAVAVFRPGADLAQAFLRDVQRIGLDRRLQQIELEHLMMHRPGQLARGEAVAPSAPAPVVVGVPLEHLEADLDLLLQRVGSGQEAAVISQQLAMAVRPGPIIGPLLDELAFDTTADLDQARRLLLELWNAHHASSVSETPEPDEPAAAPGETLGERLVRTLDEGLSQKRDVDDLFAQLERMAGIEPDPEDEEDVVGEEEDDEDDREDARPMPAPSEDEAAGNLAPLVEEYGWETGRDPQLLGPLRLLAELQQNTPLPHADLEAVTSQDVMRLLLHVYLASGPSERAARVRSAFAELREFYRWAAASQEIAVTGVLEGCHGPMLDQLDRLQAAGQELSTPSAPSVRPTIVQVDELAPTGCGVRDDDGDDHWMAASASALQHLRVGDLVLGALAPDDDSPSTGIGRGWQGLVVVLPADAKSLME